ncbi:hypothetical protein FRB99_006863 [Tulasnella sp. 403]|nr:hypothetical protein FRB99_006863 [Tulasnella sp. 403]
MTLNGTAVGNAPLKRAFLDPLHRRTTFRPSLLSDLRLTLSQCFSFIVSTVCLVAVVLYACLVQVWTTVKRRLVGPRRCPKIYDWDGGACCDIWGEEELKRDLGYYAKRVGMEMREGVAETEDGYFLKMHRVVNPREKKMEGRRDTKFFWGTTEAFSIWDIANTVVAIRDSGIGLVAHSQGAGAAFIALSQGMRPDIGEKLAVFIALAPAVYAGPLTSTWLFTTLGNLDWHSWKRFFGVLDFIPLMRYSYDHVPSTLFSIIGYAMFAYLFQWTDKNWLLRRKTKQFQFTPTPVSSASVFWWCGKDGFASRGCALDASVPQWFDDRFPPVSIYYGGCDYLVDVPALLDRLKTERHVRVNRVTRIDEAEHCDFYYAAEAVEWCYSSFVEDIERSRPRYPHEIVTI